ncbi:hypothetical protein D2T29_00515 [Sinirhodobacter populi]|uniref:Uncharacterized protein n=1 Tax=Paenirhodobacter populi TaxID=2306993 RepID=A0A443KIF4_9RHOB|nr:hypothetical protein [Sinirhodobacter populi]RWR32514.1 hypothetical protein D2T31_00585 [Sinirhodobacter populi]RWR34994.1 hypothetical protein D2T29_00515 [Sinirhodobacter populi]
MLASTFERLATLFASPKAASPVARRWRMAAKDQPALKDDVLSLGGVMTSQAYERIDGVPQLSPIDPYRLAYEAGRRDFALQLAALMDVSLFDLKSLMEDDDE